MKIYAVIFYIGLGLTTANAEDSSPHWSDVNTASSTTSGGLLVDIFITDDLNKAMALCNNKYWISDGQGQRCSSAGCYPINDPPSWKILACAKVELKIRERARPEIEREIAKQKAEEDADRALIEKAAE
jgi:hypothetical protein